MPPGHGGLKKYNPRYKSLRPLGNRLKNLIAQILLLHIVMRIHPKQTDL